MNIYPTLEQFNYQILLLGESMIGCITPNFRMITLSFKKEKWIIDFYLEKENEEDLEEIEEIVVQYEAFQEGPIPLKYNIIFGNDVLNISKISSYDPQLRVIYKRKEH